MPRDDASQPTARILLFEPGRAVQGALRTFLEEAGHVVEVVPDAAAAVRSADDAEPGLVIAGAEGSDRTGEELCARIKAEVSAKIPVVLLYAPGDADAERRASVAGADSYLVAPLKRHAVVTVARDMLRIRALLDQIEALERRLEALRDEGRAGEGEAGRPTVGGDPVYDFEFFKKLLLMEVKRSKRYAYPISLALVAFDGFQEVAADLDAKARGRLVGALLAVITRAIRDIDLPVLYAEDKVLVFMPHTARAGALIVGGRLRDRIRAHAADPDVGGAIRVTASIGIAAFEGQGTVSFGSLIKDATTALRKAQVSGGDAVEAAAAAPKSRVSIG